MEIWKKCSKAIIEDDMKIADEEKKKVEADQRIREAKRKADVRLLPLNSFFGLILQDLLSFPSFLIPALMYISS